MKKDVIKAVLGIAVVCAVGFFLGYSIKNVFNEKVIASREYVNENETEIKTGYHTDIFASDLYTCTYNEGKDAYKFVKKNIQTKASDSMYCKRKDTLSIAEKILDNKYDLVLKDSDNACEIYEEYKDGYPTGGIASFVFDENGVMIEAYFRKGKIYEVDETSMISYDEAYDIGICEIYKKYGEDTLIDGTSKDCSYEIIYRPDLEMMCYSIQTVYGHMYGDMENDINQVNFYMYISIDGKYVEIASTLGY